MSSATAAPPSETSKPDTDDGIDPVHADCVARLKALSQENGGWRIKLKRSQEEIARLRGVEDAFIRLTDALSRQRLVQS